MATITVPSQSLPNPGDALDPRPIRDYINNIVSFLESTNIDEANVDLTSTDGLVGKSTTQTITGAKSFVSDSGQHAIRIGAAADNDGSGVRFLGSSTTHNYLLGNQVNTSGACELLASTATGGTTFTTGTIMSWIGATTRVGVSTSAPQSVFHIEAGTKNVGSASTTRGDYALLIEHDASTSQGIAFSNASAIHAAIGGSRDGTDAGSIFVYTKPSAGSLTQSASIASDGDFIVGANASDTNLGDGGTPQKIVLWGGSGYGLLHLTTSDVSDGGTMGAITFGTTGATTAGSNEKRTAVISSNRVGVTNTTTPAGELLFLTSAGTDGVAPARRLHLDKDGNIVPGTAALATAATNGFTLMQTCPGTPSGTPTAYAGRAQQIYDTANNIIYIWNPVALAWKKTAALT